ncbi:metal ABC transporter solute-binding protein, Zn/Mn family [Mobiluncus mulieris]|nr:zinc ABC transporter substrate-binding protein [Mobiluncus mulieris]
MSRFKNAGLAMLALAASCALAVPGLMNFAAPDSKAVPNAAMAPHATGTTTANDPPRGDRRKLHLVTTTALLADLVKQIAGERGEVTSLVPKDADPHSYEPTLRDVRNIVYADAAFANYLMLEEHSLIRAIDANLSPRAVNVNLAEESAANGVKLIPLVEDVTLNTVWLGLRVRSGEIDDARQGEVLDGARERKETVAVKATCVEYQTLEAATGGAAGKVPPEVSVHAYLTGTFGNPTRYWDLTVKPGATRVHEAPEQSRRDAKNSSGAKTGSAVTIRRDAKTEPSAKAGQTDTAVPSCHAGTPSKAVALPVGAHTHLSWAFSHPGVYRLHLQATSKNVAKSLESVLTFLVGSSPEQIPQFAGKTAVNRGHVDLSARREQNRLTLELYGDEQESTPESPESLTSGSHDADSEAAGGTRNHGGTNSKIDAATTVSPAITGLAPRETETKHEPEPDCDHGHGNEGSQGYKAQRAYSLADSVVVVPNQALTQIPASPEFRFLGRPGTEVYQLAQAVLGKHIHGTLDPHTWHDVKNAIAYLRTITDTLTQLDPANARYYQENRDRAVERLERLDAWMREVIGSIPASKRYLVTTHDAYGYLGAAYGVNIAGFVSPNPGVQPSTKDLVALNRTLDALQVKAVFLEPNLAAYAATLRELAGQRGIAVCRIYGDAFDPTVQSYIDMMQANALALKECLDPGAPPPAVPFPPQKGK